MDVKYLIVALAACLGMWSAEIASASGGRIELATGFSLDEYLSTGTDTQRAELSRRIEATSPSERLHTAAVGVARPVVIVVFSSMSCPDCTAVVPFLCALADANPRIALKFFARNRTTEAFLRERTGESKVPTVLLSAPDGHLYDGVFVERPRAVRALSASAKDEGAVKKIVDDFRSGAYDAEIEADLIALLEGLR